MLTLGMGKLRCFFFYYFLLFLFVIKYTLPLSLPSRRAAIFAFEWLSTGRSLDIATTEHSTLLLILLFRMETHTNIDSLWLFFSLLFCQIRWKIYLLNRARLRVAFIRARYDTRPSSFSAATHLYIYGKWWYGSAIYFSLNFILPLPPFGYYVSQSPIQY